MKSVPIASATSFCAFARSTFKRSIFAMRWSCCYIHTMRGILQIQCGGHYWYNAGNTFHLIELNAGGFGSFSLAQHVLKSCVTDKQRMKMSDLPVVSSSPQLLPLAPAAQLCAARVASARRPPAAWPRFDSTCHSAVCFPHFLAETPSPDE